VSWRKRVILAANGLLALAWVGALIALVGCGLLAMWAEDMLEGRAPRGS
jgi:hypothetical protein